jgi:hypothetical protein
MFWSLLLLSFNCLDLMFLDVYGIKPVMISLIPPDSFLLLFSYFTSIYYCLSYYIVFETPN